MDDVTGGHHTASLLMAMANKPSPHTGMPNEPPQHMMPSMGYGHGLASNTIMVPSLGMGGMGPPEMYHGHGHHQGVPAACFVQRRAPHLWFALMVCMRRHRPDLRLLPALF
jgi:hypothetical protein